MDIDNLLEELDLDSPDKNRAAAKPAGQPKHTREQKQASNSYFDNSSPETSPKSNPSRVDSSGATISKLNGAGADSIDELLDDLDCVSPSPADRSGGGSIYVNNESIIMISRNSEQERNEEAKACGSMRKCFPVCLAGSRDEHGMSPGRGCDNLRCTKCDFKVLRVADRRWKEDVEYLFFRNFYPNLDKLGAKLVKSPGACSYACQCTWRSVTEVVSLDKSPDMRWVCGGH